MKRPAKTKRRRPAKPRAPASAPIVFSDRLLVGAQALVSGKDGGPDAKVVELFLAWSAVQAIQHVLLEHVRRFGGRARDEGRDGNNCPALCAVRRVEEALFPQKCALVEALAASPAQTPCGLALKLLVWRWESSNAPSGKLDDLEDVPAYSAYADLLRLTGLSALAHPRDKHTDALLKAGEALEIES